MKFNYWVKDIERLRINRPTISEFKRLDFAERTINFNKKRIEEVELFPYNKLIANGLSSVMVAHLNVPSLESRTNYPSSLSKPIITDLLKSKLNFH